MCRLITILFIAIICFGFKEDPRTSYINKYKNLAISEMHKTGIPASIKLAQGLLESGAGTSELATKANNHFGIKCGGSWTGGTYGVEDDEYKNGKKIKSCFRVFDSAHQSFIEHSRFLTDQKRYAFLFGYSNRDYYAWAKGLRKAGYATDKKYPKKLIDIINKYQLYLFDDVKEDEQLLANTDLETSSKNADKTGPQVKDAANNETHTKKSTSEEKEAIIVSNNTYPKTNKSQSKKHNRSPRTNLEARYHIVAKGQSMRDIARIYNLDKTILRLRNRIPRDAEPLAGEKLYLRDKISLLSRPQFIRDGMAHKKSKKDDEYLF